jgi:hypothetical protein
LVVWGLLGLALGPGGSALMLDGGDSQSLSVGVPDWPHRVEVRLQGRIVRGARQAATGWMAVMQVEWMAGRGDSLQPAAGRVRLRWDEEVMTRLPAFAEQVEVQDG